MHGCNGKMGQTISGLIAADEEIEIVAGIDAYDKVSNPYPVFREIDACDVEADVVIDFSAAPAIDALLTYCVERKLPCVLCTTGLSGKQLEDVKEASGKVAVLKSANMSLGINLLFKMLKEAAGVLAEAGFDIEIVEKHHNLKKDAPSGRRLPWQIPLMKRWAMHTSMSMTGAECGSRERRRRSGSAPSGAEPSWATMT